MIKGLKISMIAWAVIGFLYALVFILFPNQLLGMFGVSPVPNYVQFFMVLLGNAYILSGIFVILAARDPLKHILWVQLAMAWAVLDLVASLVFIIRGNLTFLQAGNAVIVDIIILAAFLIFYPWRKSHSSDNR
ncbi:MAG TPA: hypothetical protein VF780_03460 [Nitrosospira sp.]